MSTIGMDRRAAAYSVGMTGTTAPRVPPGDRPAIEDWLDEVYRLIDTTGHSGLTEVWPLGAHITPPSQADRLTRFKERSGLTWDQVAGAMAVTKRAVLHWQAGRPMTSRHEERLARLQVELDVVDVGDPDRTRSVLLQIDDLGSAPYQRWLEAVRRRDEQRAWIGRQPG